MQYCAPLIGARHHCLTPRSHNSKASGSSSIHASNHSGGSRCSNARPGGLPAEKTSRKQCRQSISAHRQTGRGVQAGHDTGNNKQASNFRMQSQAVQAVNFRMQSQAVQAGNFRMASQTVQAVNFSKQAITATHTCGIFNVINRRHVCLLHAVCMRTSMAMCYKISATARWQRYASIRCTPIKVAASASPATSRSIPRRFTAR